MPNPPADRRREILDAALSCFLDAGYLATSMSDIRRRSGASTGSIYHFFAGKAAIAEALLRQALAGWYELSQAHHDTAEEEIKSSVRGLVLWGLANPKQARFLDELRGLALHDPELGNIRNLLEAGHSAAAARFAQMQASGAARNLPFSIAHALMLGPAYSYLRQAPPLSSDEASRIADLFADAAWQAVRRNG